MKFPSTLRPFKFSGFFTVGVEMAKISVNKYHAIATFATSSRLELELDSI